MQPSFRRKPVQRRPLGSSLHDGVPEVSAVSHADFQLITTITAILLVANGAGAAGGWLLAEGHREYRDRPGSFNATEWSRFDATLLNHSVAPLESSCRHCCVNGVARTSAGNTKIGSREARELERPAL